MLVVPTQAVPNQTFQVALAGQAVQINIYQYAYGLFMDVFVNGIPIVTGVICENLNRIVRSLYLGLVGDFIWFDTQGTGDPVYTGLGTRWQLVYLETADLPAGQG